MQPAQKFTGWFTNDLTQCVVNHLICPITGASIIVAFYPAEWEKIGEKQVVQFVGGPMEVQGYKVTKWSEIELARRAKPKRKPATKTKPKAKR